jgi:hypothetical protein
MISVVGYLLIAIIEVSRLSYDLSGVFLVVPLLAALSAPMLAKARRSEPDPWIGRLFTRGLLAMLAIGLVHFALSRYLYEGGDAASFNLHGAVLAAQFWQGDFIPRLNGSVIGNNFMYLLTGVIYAFIGPTIVGGYLVYAWLGFWGIYFFYRAFRTAMPEADHRRYAVLIFFLPSILYWPSAISKEAWMMLCTGLALLGVARLLRRTPWWALPLSAGITGTALVRPNITALLAAGLFAGVLIRKKARPTLLSPIARAASIVRVIAAGAIVIRVAANFLKLDSVSTSSVTGAINKVQGNTGIGGSAFAAHTVNSPLDLPGAMVTVLFRPFPWEAENLVMLASSVEGSLLMLFIALSWRRWYRAPRLLREYPYVMTALVVILLFVIAFSALGNFGLLVRERAMILPLVLVPLCLAHRTAVMTSGTDYLAVERVKFR